MNLDSKSIDGSEPRCHVPGCDSRGHLSGKFDYHFSQMTCPIYHNLTPEDCFERYQKRQKRRDERSSPSDTQKNKLRKSSSSPEKSKDEKINGLLETRRKEQQQILSSPKRTKSGKQKTSR